jgi:paraquat-inducible protein A
VSNNNALVACPDCDFLARIPPLRGGERAICPRCHAVLRHKKAHGLDRALVCSLTALIFFVLANTFPFMIFKLQGREQITFLASGGLELYRQGFWGLSALVLALGIIFPCLRITGILYVLIPLKLNRHPWQVRQVFKFVEAITPWAMMEVLMLGVIVAYVKLIDLATIVLGPSLYSFAALIVFMTVSAAVMDPTEIWERLEALR